MAARQARSRRSQKGTGNGKLVKEIMVAAKLGGLIPPGMRVSPPRSSKKARKQSVSRDVMKRAIKERRRHWR